MEDLTQLETDSIEETLRRLPPVEMLERAEHLALAEFGPTVTYSRKVFIPLTRLCRDVCHYCTFAASPRRLEDLFLSREAVLSIARAGVAAGCREALFTLGDRPEVPFSRLLSRIWRSMGASSCVDRLLRTTRVALRRDLKT